MLDFFFSFFWQNGNWISVITIQDLKKKKKGKKAVVNGKEHFVFLVVQEVNMIRCIVYIL